MNSQPLILKDKNDEKAGHHSNAQEIITTSTPLNYPNQNDEAVTQIPINIINQDENIKEEKKFQIDYSKYKYINQLKYNVIIQKDKNTFSISKPGSSCFACYAFIGLILGAGSLWRYSATGNGLFIMTSILLFIGFVLNCYLSCTKYNSVDFTLRNNDILIEQQASCGKKMFELKYDQILKIEFSCKTVNKCGGISYNYKISFSISNNGILSEKIYYDENNPKQRFTDEEIGYFNYIMNSNIGPKMNLKDLNLV